MATTISRGIVGIYAESYGRGPKQARTHVHDEYVLTILEESFTTADRTLLRAGKARQVEETRRAFQDAVRDQFIDLVESATGRPVAVHMSKIDTETETAVELFLMEAG